MDGLKDRAACKVVIRLNNLNDALDEGKSFVSVEGFEMSTDSITNMAAEDLGGQDGIELHNVVRSIGGVEASLDTRGND